MKISEKERRRFRRISTNLVVLYLIKNNKKNVDDIICSIETPKTIDLSMTGIKISNKKKLKIGEKLKVLISLIESCDSIIIIGKVVWTKHNSSSDLYETGVKITKFITNNKNKLKKFIQGN